MSDIHHKDCPQAVRAEHRHTKWRKTDHDYNSIIYCSVCGSRCLCRELDAQDEANNG